ncbi:hypothetical protein A0O34_21890 (plasmid) [Chryseobacterium glaciei]|uniref:Topo IA-type catalytic domain-containing protein n=1 Tax=Chryseobacterium glaciei TaxID=1685010 RepID=A0A172Y1Z1_9FLAO|nr:hypothetical protein A0O34_21890 [Chryseobacterium glaciei]
MENCGKEIENVEERKALQNVGIGTPATRAAIIETLFSRDYIKREKKTLFPTEKGLKVYDFIKEKKIADAAMTGEWELALQKIENGEASAEDFQLEIENYTRSITEELLSVSLNTENLPDLICPKCKTMHLLIRDKIVKCPDAVCNWILFRSICGVQLNVKKLKTLLIRKDYASKRNDK